METGTLAAIGILILAMGLIPGFFHIRSYSKLLGSIRARGLDVGRLEPEWFDYGSRGFIVKIKTIESKYLSNGALSKEEEKMLYASKRAYYAMAPFILGFLIALALMVFLEK